MGICWGIVMAEGRYEVERWVGLVGAGLTDRLVVPFVDGRGLELTRGPAGVVSQELDATEIRAEVRLLATSDLTYEQVERRFDGFSVFLPDRGPSRRLPAHGFE